MEYLNKIQTPNDLKKIPISQLDVLADEIRQAILHRSFAYGGHVASNLGVVELTIALHYVFDTPKDQFVFDCSHQCYAHKMLTGRYKGYTSSEEYNHVSGYTNPAESEYDLFEVGHTSTSISLASGLAVSRDLLGVSHNVIAVVGDGALSGGEALEGLNFIGGELHSNCIIIVNDNNMSIAENHGGIYANLQLLRETFGTADCNIFKSMGFDYCYVDNGHDIAILIDLFKQIKDIDHPIVIHIHTTKGKGFKFAENNPELWHYYLPMTNEYLKDEYYAEITREALRIELTKKNNIVYVTAATPALLPFSMGFEPAERNKMGRHFIDVGIAEEHAIAMISAIARNGCKPVFSVMATFLQRSYDQLIHDLCINSTPALLLVWGSGIFGLNDKTHIGHFDIQELAHIPNLLYLVPTCCEEYTQMLRYGMNDDKQPIAIRVPSNTVFHSHRKTQSNFEHIGYEVVKKGRDVAIIALGTMFQLGEQVIALYYKRTGQQITLINPRYISDIDIETLESLKADHKLILTLEDGILEGGWGQKIASYLGNSEIKVKNYGLKKTFSDRYSWCDLLYENRLVDRLIVKDIQQMLKN